VNGDPAESDLTPLSRQQFDDLAINTNVHWVSRGESFSLAGGAASGQSSWWWLAATVLLLLVLEMSVLAWPTLRSTETVAPHAL
jgi:hypothetical protein